MNLSEYFTTTAGTGVLATADSFGRVDAAIYSRPHFLEDGRLAFVMRDRLTHSNLRANPHAAYLFIEAGDGYRGKRLFLEKTGESEDRELVESLKRRASSAQDDGQLFVVFFKITRELPLIGGSPTS